SPALTLLQSGQYVDAENRSASTIGHLTFKQGRLYGNVRCLTGQSQPLNATVASGQIASLSGLPLRAAFVRPPPPPGATSHNAAPAKPRPLEATVAIFL